MALAQGLALLLCIATVRSQDESLAEAWRWVKFTVDDGLPSNRIHDIVETESGTVWALTGVGLAYYDGVKWHRVGEDTDLPRARVSGIAADGSDGVWVVVRRRLCHGSSQGLELAQPSRDGRLPPVLSIAYLSPSAVAICTLKDNRNQIWLYNRAADRLTEMELPAAQQFPSSVELWSTAPGSMFVRFGRELYRWRSGTWKAVLPYEEPRLLVRSVVADSTDGVVLLIHGTGGTGIWSWRDGVDPRRERREGSLPVAMDVAPDKSRVFVYPSGELRVWRESGWSELITIPGMSSLPSSARFRRNGDLWIGTDSGLFLHKRSSQRWKRFAEPGPDVRNHVISLLIAKDGSMWKGTPGGIHVQHIDGSAEWIDEIDGRKIRTVTGLCQDGHGNIWISSGSEFTGAYRFDGVTWHREREGGIGDCFIHRIELDSAGRTWFCALRSRSGSDNFGPGPFVYESGRMRLFPMGPALARTRVYAFVEGPDGARWFGTSHGVRRWRDGEWTQWTMSEGLRLDSVFALAMDSGGRPWFCHRFGGVGRIELNGLVIYHPAIARHQDVAALDIEFDRRGDLWISTSEGVRSLRGDIWTQFDRRSLLAGVRSWPIAVDDELIYFGTLGRGVVRLDPREAAPSPPIVTIREPVIEERKAYIWWQAHAAWGDMRPSEIQTRWQLDGGDWSAWSRSRSMQTVGLAGGQHTFRLQAKGYFGDVQAAGSLTQFEIPPPFYGQKRFYLPVGLLLIALLALSLYLVERRRRLQSMHRAFDQQLARSDKMEAISRLAGGIAHDFNNFLLALMGNAELMREHLRSAPDPALEAYLAEIERASVRASEMTHQLLVIGHGEGAMVNSAMPDQAIAQMESMLRGLVPKGIELNLTLNAPDSAVGMERVQFERIVMNLVMNATQSIRGEGSVWIETRVRETSDPHVDQCPSGRYYCMEVKDTGCGLDEATISHIFEPFFTTKEFGKGTGLGLSTVHGLLQHAGGFIDVESEVSSGSTFRVLLPDCPASDIAEDKVVERVPERRSGAKETILLCEDNPAVRSVMRRTLEQDGYSVIEAVDGQDALRVVDDGAAQIDMVVSDVMMPNMSGRGLVAALSERDCPAKILLVSGFEFHDLPDRGSKSNGSRAISYLQKPFTNRELLRSVREILA